MKKINLSPSLRSYLNSILNKYNDPIDFVGLKNKQNKIINDCKSKCDEIDDNLKNNRISKKEAKKRKAQARAKKSNMLKKIATELLKNYTKFSHSNDVYAFTGAVPVKCCPYCNLYPIPTVKGAERPDIDHFEAKIRVPEKQLDLENLIPCCAKCNRDVKKEKHFSLSSHINPYLDDFDSAVEFDIIPYSSDYTKEENFEITIKRNSSCPNLKLYNKAKNNITDLKLKERYQAFKKDVTLIFENQKKYFEKKQKEIIDLTNETSNLRNELFPDENCDINSTERGKLKRDIIKHYIKQ